MVFPIVGGNQSTGDIVTNSLRFNDDDSAYLTSGTLSSPNTDKFTVSFWVKISGARANIFSIGKRLTGETGDYYALTVDLGSGTGSGRLSLGGYNGVADSNTIAVNTDTTTGPLFRDPSAWQHHVYAFDTGQGTAGNRFKWYLNGVLQSGYNTTTTPSQNADLFPSSGSMIRIGKALNTETRFADCYIADYYYVDGQQYDHTYFGETNDNGVWVPIKYTGTFGNNGVFLEYKQTGTSQNSSGLGADTSGNDNHFAVNNLTAVSQSTDTCTNNFCVMNHLDNYFAGSTFSNGNLQVNTANSPYTYNTGTMGMTKGKWYFEGKWISAGSGNSAVGIISTVSTGTSDEAPNKTDSAMYKDDGVVRRNNGNGTSIAEVSNNNLIMVAYDADNNFAYFGYKFMQFRKNEKYRTQELNHRVQCLLDQMKQEYQSEREAELNEEPVANIFREHVIDEISKQRLIYDEESGRYIRLRQIK